MRMDILLNGISHRKVKAQWASKAMYNKHSADIWYNKAMDLLIKGYSFNGVNFIKDKEIIYICYNTI